MKGEVQNKKVLVRDKEMFIGVDVHKESWHVFSFQMRMLSDEGL